MYQMKPYTCFFMLWTQLTLGSCSSHINVYIYIYVYPRATISFWRVHPIIHILSLLFYFLLFIHCDQFYRILYYSFVFFFDSFSFVLLLLLFSFNRPFFIRFNESHLIFRLAINFDSLISCKFVVVVIV